jgi:superkiller protein 3
MDLLSSRKGAHRRKMRVLGRISCPGQMSTVERSLIGATVVASIVVCIAGCGPKPEVPHEPVPPGGPEDLTIEARIELAQAYMDSGRVGDAAGHYRKVLEDDPNSFEANLNLGIALMTMEDAKFVNERDYEEIRRHFAAARNTRGGDARPYIYLGTLDFKEKDYGSATDRLSVARELDPNNESVREMLGLSLLEVGMDEAGRRELRQALEINPYNQAANFELGKTYEGENRNELAMTHLERALAANPNMDRAVYVLERVYYEEGFYDRAEKTCRQFLKFHPEDIQSLEILGWVYERQERTEEMLEIYGELARIRPDNTAYWSPVIQHYMDNDDYAQARNILEESLKHNPYYAYGNVRYGQVLMHYGDESLRNGDRQQALELLTRAKDHLQKAKVDDRYVAPASQLIDRVDSLIRSTPGR